VCYHTVYGTMRRSPAVKRGATSAAQGANAVAAAQAVRVAKWKSRDAHRRATRLFATALGLDVFQRDATLAQVKPFAASLICFPGRRVYISLTIS
jgi:hypothetical protein